MQPHKLAINIHYLPGISFKNGLDCVRLHLGSAKQAQSAGGTQNAMIAFKTTQECEPDITARTIDPNVPLNQRS